MAARSHKIFREILFKHYRYNSKIVSPIFSNVTRNCSQNVTKKKPSLKLTHLEFGKDSANSYLQPASLPAFSTHHKRFDVKWPQNEQIKITRTKATVNDASKSQVSSPFLSSITRNIGLATQNRNCSTLMINSTRYYSNKKWGNQTEPEECPIRRECYKPCPKWQLHNCPPQGDNLDCLKPYTDPCCKKKLAPYPSYSESCAERLEDDPSECMQCPWKRCGGSESLKYPKRKYHTGTAAAFHRFATTAVPPIDIARIEIPIIRCDAKKPPCKRPPGKCDKLQKKEPCPEEKKGPCPPPFERKKCDKEKKASNRWIDVYQMWNDKNNILPIAEEWTDVIDPIEEQSPAVAIRAKKDDCQEDRITPDNSCCLKLPFDKKQMDYEIIRHKQCHKPNCRRKKRKMVPDDCDGKCNKKCASPETQFGIDVGYECQKKKKRCPRGDCHRPKCPDRDQTIDQNHMELARDHDKGHPPPCPNWRKPSKQCPKPEKCKKPYRQQHDLNEPFYRRQRKPWAEIDTGHGERKPDFYS